MPRVSISAITAFSALRNSAFSGLQYSWPVVLWPETC